MKSCVICGETELKRYRVVTGENARAWSQLVGSTLYPGQRICGSHVPPGWKKKVVMPPSGEDESGDPIPSLPPPSPVPTVPPRPPSWEHHHLNPPVNPDNTASKFRLHCNLKGTSVKFIVPVSPQITVKEFCTEISLRYAELFANKRATKKTFIYEITGIEDNKESQLWGNDQLIDVVDNHSLVRFEGRRINTGPKIVRRRARKNGNAGKESEVPKEKEEVMVKEEEDESMNEKSRLSADEEEEEDEIVVEEDEEEEDDEELEIESEVEVDEEEEVTSSEEENLPHGRKRKGSLSGEEKKKKKAKKELELEENI